MSASTLKSGVLAGAAALAVATALALPAWGQGATENQPGEPVELAPAPAEQAAPEGSLEAQQPAASGQSATGSGAPSTEAAGGEAAAPAGAEAQPEQSASETETPPETATETAPEGETAGAESGYILGDVALGDPDAPLTVYEYASFTCPHCATFHTQTFPEFKEKYIETGKVRYVLREVYFDQYGLWASMVARCGGEQGFYPLVDAFLGSQSTWTRAPDIGHAIQQVGRRAGLPAERLQQCLSDREFAKTLLEEYQANREADEIQSTPTFVIEGEKYTGAMPFEEFAAIVDEAL